MNVKMSLFALAAVVAMIFVSVSPAMPGVVGQTPTGVQVLGIRARATIDSSYAVTDFQVRFGNPTDQNTSETFVLQIPEDAFISNFSLTLKGHTYFAKVMKAQDAALAYANATEHGDNAGLMASEGGSSFAYSVNVAAHDTVVVALRYEQYIPRTPQGFRYSMPLSSYAGKSVGVVDVAVDLNYDRPIKTVTAQSYQGNANISMSDLNRSASATFKLTNCTVRDDFMLTWDLAPLPVNGNMLFYEVNGEGYFFHVFSPGVQELGGYLPKDIIFVLDHSGSMDGQKLTQVKSAFKSVIMDLQGNDNFAILTFSTTVTPVFDKLVPATGDNKKDAIEKIQEVESDQSTNINQALLDAIDMLQSSSDRVPIIVFLTDGLPTEGVTGTDQIRENILAANTKGVRIYSLGFGNDVDFEFLRALALENKGYAIKIEEGRDAAGQIKGFYNTISLPTLMNLDFTYSNGTYDVFPTHVDTLYDGSEVVICGRTYNSVKTVSFKASATTATGPREFQGDFTVKASPDNAFIARYWAYAKIRSLADQITVAKDAQTKANLEEQATNMSLENGFVTQYTSLFVDIPKDVVTPPPATASTDQGVHDMTTTSTVPTNPYPTYTGPTTGTAHPKVAPTKGSASVPGFEGALVLPAIAIIALIVARRKKDQ
jgi:uncharacterized protein YegL